MALFVAGCGGGGRGAGAGVLPSLPGSAGPSDGVKVNIAIPIASSASAGRKDPAFVVAATNGLEIGAKNASNVQVADQTYDVSSSSPQCTTSGGLRTCSLLFAIARGGPYTFTVTSYDQAPVGGVIPGGAHVLAVGIMANATVDQGQANTFNATLYGTPATLAFGSARSVVLSNGTASSVALPLVVKDASGTSIVGAFSTAIAAGVTESGGHTLLSIDGGATKAASVPVASSTDAAALQAYYDGNGAAAYSATVGASGGGTSSASTVLDAFGVARAAIFGTPSVANRAASFSAPSQKVELTPSEPNFAGSFTQSTTCAGAVLVASAGSAFDLTSVLPTASCRIDISDGIRTFSTPVSVTTTSGSIGIPPPTGTTNVFATLSGSMIPSEIALGPDGKMWFVADDGTDGEFGSVDASGTLHEYPMPGTTPRSIALGPDGKMWAGDCNAPYLYSIDTATHATQALAVATAGVQAIAGVAAGPDGDLWITDPTAAQVDSFTTGGTLVSQTNVPFASAPSAIITGPDGAIWFGDAVAGQLGRIDPATHAIARFPTIYPSGVGALRTGSDGAIWFTSLYGGGLGRMTTAGAFSFFPATHSGPVFGLASAPDNAIWYTSCTCSAGFGRMTTGGAESVYATASSEPYDVAVGSDGGLWFTDDVNRQIGRIQP